ncbi:MAG: hypothetical protein M3022_07575 [Actinomycetota bacterium]|nr:hypothetical protein [Actinomycetota bacterium]
MRRLVASSENRPPRQQLSLLAIVVVIVLAGLIATPATARADETVTSCGLGPNQVFGHASVFGISATQTCGGQPFGPYVELRTNGNAVPAGARATWQALAPAGLLINNVAIPSFSSAGVNDGKQYGGGFYWQGSGYALHDQGGVASFGTASNNPGFPSPYFGFQLVCGANPCTTSGSSISVAQVNLDVSESTGPALLPGKLWGQHGWVRGDWPLSVNGDSPSGVCSLSASLDGQLLANQSFPADTSGWHQCDAAGAGGLNTTVHTTQFSNASHTLTASGGDAAGLSATPATTINVDNQPPTVTLSGPTDAPSTAGAQYITASASAGPSGVDQITCSGDGAPAQSYSGATARVPVNGLGTHSVTCTTSDNAVDANGGHGQSAPASFSIRIGAPTVTAIGFTRIVDGLRCHRAAIRQTVPAHLVTRARHHHRIRVRIPARTRSVRVVRCHPRVVVRRRLVTVVIRRHGHRVRVRRRRAVRVVLLPHADRRTIKVVGHGRGATVSGWLGTADGVALGGQTVSVLTAPDDGGNAFAPAVTAVTAADGSWSAHLPAGPGRLIEASYAGASTAEPSTSGLAKLVVPARVLLLEVAPQRIAWGGTVRLTGRLAGGYLPPGGALVRLRIGLGTTFTTYGVHEHVTGSGRFSTSYTFGAGQPSTHRRFWFQIASLPMGDYPYAPANSRRIDVTVGGHPRPAHGRTRRR